MDSEQLVLSESGERQHPAHDGSRRRQFLKPVLLNAPLIALVVAILIIVTPIWQPGYPWGSDSWGHLQRAAYMGQSIHDQGLIAGIAQSEWMPDWYMGDPMRVYYPPLVVWFLGPLTALIGDVFVAYRVFITAIFLALGISVYAVGTRWGHNRVLAAAGALLAVSAPYTLHTVFAEGNLSRGLAVIALPWLVWYAEITLLEKASHRVFILSSVLWALVIVAHVMQAVIFAEVIALYVVFRTVGQIYIPLRRAGLALMPIAFGGAIAACYLIPAYSHLELSNVPSLPGVKIDLFSTDLSSLLPYHDSIEAISVGIATIVLSLLAAFFRANPHHKAMFAVGVVCVILAFGPSGGLFLLAPLNQSLLPERFLNVSAVLFPLLIATLPYGHQRRNWALATVVLILIVDFLPAWRVVHMRDAPPDESTLATYLARFNDDGRVAPLTFPNPTSPQLFLTSEVGKHPSVSGWALENTPNQDAIRRLLAAVDRSPDYLTRVLSLWNTNYLLTRVENPSKENAIRRELPYRIIGSSNDLNLWLRTSPASFAQQLPDNRMLIIGNNATSWLFAFPFASEGESPNPSAYTPEDLARYSVIGMNRLPDNADVEGALGDWVRQGNTLIVDLSGMGRIYEQGFTLFGVHTIPLSLNGDFGIHWPPELQSMPQILPFVSDEGAWTGATYYGLDAVTASLTYQGEEYPVLGYRNVGQGRVWYVSFNLVYLLDQSGYFRASQALVDYLLASTPVDRSLVLPSFDAATVQRQPDSITMDYDSPQDVSVVLSMTYFPRWQAFMDGQPLALQSHEHMMMLELPAGQHHVSLQFRPFSSPVFWLGWAVTIVFMGLTIVFAFLLKRHPLLSFDQRSKTFDDRLPQPTGPVITDYVYAPCPNCQFPFAVLGPPNEQTYPFFSTECPVCGFALNYEGVMSGEEKHDMGHDEMVRNWLKKSDINEEQLLALFGIKKIDELFKG